MDKQTKQTPSEGLSQKPRVEKVLSDLQTLLGPHAHCLSSPSPFLTRRRKYKQLQGAKADRSHLINTALIQAEMKRGRGRTLHFSLDPGLEVLWLPSCPRSLDSPRPNI